MKYIIIAVTMILCSTILGAQDMTWVPSSAAASITKNGCIDQTSCKKNTVCYKLQYTPDASGVLTSYTTGFIMDCNGGKNAIVSNQSCTMNDKSEEKVACDTYGKVLLYCSGNTGNVKVKKGTSVFLHQICVQTNNLRKGIEIVKSDIVDLTTSIDTDGGGAATDVSDFNDYVSIQNHIVCEQQSKDLYLEGTLENKTFSLKWEALNDNNLGSYFVQKKMKNGFFTTVTNNGDIVSSETVKREYTYADRDISDGEFEYRIMHSDIQGDTYSNTVTLEYATGTKGLVIYPNPAKNIIHIEMENSKSTNQLIISDNVGRLVIDKLMKEERINSIDINSLTPGIYNLSVIDGNNVITKKLIVIN